MGVPVFRTVFIFIQIYQILTTSFVSGLPFAGISSIASLKSSAESLSNEDSSPSSAAIENLIPSRPEVISSTTPLLSTSSGNFKLIISSPYVLNVDLSSDDSLATSYSISNSEDVFCETQELPKTSFTFARIARIDNLTTAENFKPSVGNVPGHSTTNFVASPLLSSYDAAGSRLFSSSNLDIDFSPANFKRAARNTKLVTLRPLANRVSVNSEASSNDCNRESIGGPFVSLTESKFATNSINDSPFQSLKTFQLSQSGLLPNPRFPCLKMPINLKSLQLSSSDSNLQSNKSPTDFLQSNSISSSISNNRPVFNENSFNSFQTGLFSTQKASSQVNNIGNQLPLSSDGTKSFSTPNNPVIQSNTVSSAAIHLQDAFSTNLDNDISINSLQNIGPSSKSSVTGSHSTNSFVLDCKPNTAQFPQNTFILQRPQTDYSVLPNQVSQVNDNFIKCQDAVSTINNIGPFKTSPQTSSLNQNNQGCLQSETATIKNNLIAVPKDDVIYQSKNFNLPAENDNGENNLEVRLNRNNQLEKLRNSINAYKNLKTVPLMSQNSNQGCPQLYSIPVNGASLLNRQINNKDASNNIVDSIKGQHFNNLIQNTNIQQLPQTVNSQNLNIALNKLNYIKALSRNPNNQGCPQLVSIQPPTNILASKNDLAKVEDSINNENNENSNIQINNDDLGPQVIPTIYIDNSNLQKIGNIATFTLNNNKINNANTQPVNNLENIQVKSNNDIKNNFILFPKTNTDNNIPSQTNEFTCQPLNNNIIKIPRPAVKLTESSNLKTVESPITLRTPSNILLSQSTPSNNAQSIKCVPSVQNIGSGPECNNLLTLQDLSSTPQGPCNQNTFSYVPLESNTGTLNNIPLSSVNLGSPCTYNVAPSVPTVSFLNLPPSVPSITQTSFSNIDLSAKPSLSINQNPYVNNNNLQNLLTLLKCNNNNLMPSNNVFNTNNLPASSLMPVQSLPQVSFLNSISSPISVSPITISLADNQNVLSSLSNSPILCTSPLRQYTSYQPIITPCTISPMLSALLPQVNLGSSSLYSSLNSMASAITQNIMSTVISKSSPSSSLSNLPPVNTYTVISECKPDDSVSLDISESLAPYLISTSSSSPRVSLPKIPIACNEYLPPLSNSQIIPINSEILFSCVEPDSYDTFTPFMMPSVSDATVYILPSY